MLGSCHYLPNFDRSHHASKIDRAKRPVSAPGATVSVLRTAWEAWCDGLAAHRHYEHLRSRGVPHEEAIKEALGVGHGRSQVAHEAARPLYFAGKA
jgi:hypothetical protein